MSPAGSTLWKPALVAGVPLGLVTAIPVVGDCLSVCCCGVAGATGMVAAMLLLSETPLTPDGPYGRGALVGFLSGAVGALCMVVGKVLMALVGLRPRINLSEKLSDSEMPSWLPEVLEYLVTGDGGNPLALLGTLAFWLIAYGACAMVGGVLGIVFFHTKRPREESFAPFPSDGPAPPPAGPPATD